MKSLHTLLPATLVLALSCASAWAQLKPPPAARSAPAETRPNGAAEAAEAEKEEEGQLAAIAWLQLLDRGDWAGAWRGASAMFRATVPQAQWMDGIPKLREPWGTPQQRMAMGAGYRNSLPGRPAGDYVTASFTSSFADKAEVEEIVTTVRESDGTWRVAGYATR